MAITHECPLCADDYEQRTDLRIHLEVEHRKSELATCVLEGSDSGTDPTVEQPGSTHAISTTRG